MSTNDEFFFFFFGNSSVDWFLSCLTQPLANDNFSTLEILFDESYYLNNYLIELLFVLCCLCETLDIVICFDLFM